MFFLPGNQILGDWALLNVVARSEPHLASLPIFPSKALESFFCNLYVIERSRNCPPERLIKNCRFNFDFIMLYVAVKYEILLTSLHSNYVINIKCDMDEAWTENGEYRVLRVWMNIWTRHLTLCVVSRMIPIAFCKLDICLYNPEQKVLFRILGHCFWMDPKWVVISRSFRWSFFS